VPHEPLLNEIYTRLQKLVKEHEQLKKENTKLKAELEKKNQQQEAFTEKEQQLKDQIAILQTTSKNLDEAGKKALEKRINEYIRNIDKTIALLHE
jgi:cell division septum initiation protein DivIVA